MTQNRFWNLILGQKYDTSGVIWGQIFNIATSSLNISQNEDPIFQNFFQGNSGLGSKFWKRSERSNLRLIQKWSKCISKWSSWRQILKKISFEVIQGHPRSEILRPLDENRSLEYDIFVNLSESLEMRSSIKRYCGLQVLRN